MGFFFDFLQYFGSLGKMVKNVVENYQKFKTEPAENDLERLIAMTFMRYFHPSIPNRHENRAKVISCMRGLVEWGEPVGLYGYCAAIAWAEMDVDRSDLETQKNILKILRSFGVSYDDAYGKTYEIDEFDRLVGKFNP